MKHAGGVRRLGPRYGLNVRKKLSKVEALKKSKKVCPYCGHESVRRVAVGIWFCDKCKKKFTGKAYTFEKQKPIITGATEEEPERPVEEEK